FAVNRAYAYSSAPGIAAVDSVHASVLRVITRESGDMEHTVVFDTWWQRFSYFYFPRSVCYDIRSYGADTLFSKLRMKDYTLYPVQPVEVLPAGTGDVFLVMREEHPDVKLIGAQAHLEKIAAPPHIDIYRITDSSFVLDWKKIRFVKN